MMSLKKNTRITGIRNFEIPEDVPTNKVEIIEGLTPQCYPVLFQAKDKYIMVSEWLKNNRSTVREQLLRHGAVLFRGFNMNIANSFQEVVNNYGREVMEYTLGAAKRIKEVDNIYLSTTHPAAEDLEMHNEMSYAADWPREILLYCDIPAHEGGETPLCDGRKIWEVLKPETREKFERLGIMYVRQLGGMFGGLTWQKVFGTEDPRDAEAKCIATGMDFEWRDNDILRMKWAKPAIIMHPETNEVAWFNHAFFFNSLVLNGDISKTLSIEEMPFFTYYGDGTSIEHAVLKELKHAFDITKSAFTWQKGDMLLVDNILLSHGRNAFRGDRKVLVAMFK